MNKVVSLLVLTLLGIAVLVFLTNLNDYQKNKSFLRDLGSTDRSLLSDEQGLSPVITTFIHERTSIDDLCDSLKTLVNVQGSIDAPVLAFHLSTTPELADQNKLQACTARPVFFHLIDINSFPEGFVPVEGKDYTEAQINRFWTSGIWKHPALNQFDLIMKIDDSTCFSIPDTTLPYLTKPTQSYKSHIFPGTVNNNIVQLQGMHNFAIEYMMSKNIVPKHNQLWQRVHYTFHNLKTVPNFQDSFEIVKKEFMLHDDIYEWTHALTDLPPYGYYTQGWNVNAERVLTMALFGSKSSIDSSLVTGFVEKDLARGNPHSKICHDPFESEIE